MDPRRSTGGTGRSKIGYKGAADKNGSFSLEDPMSNVMLSLAGADADAN